MGKEVERIDYKYLNSEKQKRPGTRFLIRDASDYPGSRPLAWFLSLRIRVSSLSVIAMNCPFAGGWGAVGRIRTLSHICPLES